MKKEDDAPAPAEGEQATPSTELMKPETTAPAYRPRNLQEAVNLARTLAQSGLIPEALMKRPADVLTVMMAGHELGLAPMQSLRGVNVIKGKASLSADLMMALILKRKEICSYFHPVEITDTAATFETLRHGAPAPVSFTYTLQDAKKANLLNQKAQMWEKHPKSMLRARCVSGLAHQVYPDLVFGVYTPDELDEVAANGSQAEPRDITPRCSRCGFALPEHQPGCKDAPGPKPKPPTGQAQPAQKKEEAAPQQKKRKCSECGATGKHHRPDCSQPDEHPPGATGQAQPTQEPEAPPQKPPVDVVKQMEELRERMEAHFGGTIAATDAMQTFGAYQEGKRSKVPNWITLTRKPDLLAQVDRLFRMQVEKDGKGTP